MIPIGLVQSLLKRLGAEIDRPVLQEAGLRATDKLPNVQPAQWMQALLAQAEIKSVFPIQLSWRRFDLRRMPALVCEQSVWYLAERRSDGMILLTPENGPASETTEESLQNALVLWLRAPARSGHEGVVNFRNNKAAQLIWAEMFREPGWVAKVLMATVLVNLIAVVNSLFAMQVYDRVVPTFAYATLTTMVAGMAIAMGLDWLLKVLRGRIVDSVSVTVDKRVSQRLFDHVLHLRLDLQPRSLGTLAAQVAGLDSVRNFFSSSIIFALVDLPFALLFLVFIGIIGGHVFWVYALLFPMALVLGLITQARLRHLLKSQLMRSNERQGVLVDAIRGAESIRAGNATWRFSEEWKAITASIDGYNVEQKAINNSSSATTGLIASLGSVATVVVGVWQVEAGLLTMGGMIACSILGGRVITSVSQGVQHLTQWQGVSQSLQMVNQVLNIEQERRPEQDLLLPELPPDQLSLERLRFSYPESPVRQIDIASLKFQAGERVVVLGPVGCGKSTLLKIMAGLYPPSEGRVRLGDADLWEMDPQVVAAQVGYLPQNVHLFKGTLKSNLALSGTASDSRLLKITRDLGVDAIAQSSPLGLGLPISEGGEGLSGGQRQLVGLARLVIDHPRIWLLDEPTASLDGESEARAWQVIQGNLRPEDILVVSTHNPNRALQLATRLLVMHQGMVLEDGKPNEVLAKLMARAKAAGAPAALNTGGRAHVV